MNNTNDSLKLYSLEDTSIEDIEENDTSTTTTSDEPKTGCYAFLRRYQIPAILVLAIVGVIIGVSLSFWNPDDAEAKSLAIQWIGLLGDLFLRALKCFVLPLVFVNVMIAVVDMMSIGQASSIGWSVIGLYLFTTVAAAFFGSMSTLMFMRFYTVEDAMAINDLSNGSDNSPLPYIQLGCNDENSLLVHDENGTVACVSKALVEEGSDSLGPDFVLLDVNETLATTMSNNGMPQVSLSDTIYEGIFEKIVPDNIIGAFANNEFAAVIFFAVLFGAALTPVIFNKKNKKGANSSLLEVLKESDSVFQRITRWIISLTPFAVCSLIAAAIGRQDDLRDVFSNIGLLVASAFVAWGFQVVFVYIGLFALLTKTNPFRYLKHIIPAQTFAFASASSAATIPSSLAAIKSTGVVPDTIGRFVVPFGATVNMDGGAVYFVCACIWLAVLNGEEVTVSSFLLLIIIATLGSIGTAPVPSASLVLIITAYNTVFQGTGTPNGFGYIFAIDWFMDRCRTTTNITGDCIVAGIVAHRFPDMENTNEVQDRTRNDSSEEGDVSHV